MALNNDNPITNTIIERDFFKFLTVTGNSGASPLYERAEQLLYFLTAMDTLDTKWLP